MHMLRECERDGGALLRASHPLRRDTPFSKEVTEMVMWCEAKECSL